MHSGFESAKSKLASLIYKVEPGLVQEVCDACSSGLEYGEDLVHSNELQDRPLLQALFAQSCKAIKEKLPAPMELVDCDKTLDEAITKKTFKQMLHDQNTMSKQQICESWMVPCPGTDADDAAVPEEVAH